MTSTFNLIKGQEAYSSELAFVLFKLDQEFFPTPWNQESWTNLFSDHNRFLVTISNSSGEVSGFCLFDLSVADSFAHLLKILVNPNRQQSGLGEKLLNTALENLLGRSIAKYFLEVELTNSAACKLYERCGFKKIHQKKDFYGQGRDALIMIREL